MAAKLSGPMHKMFACMPFATRMEDSMHSVLREFGLNKEQLAMDDEVIELLL